MISIQTIVYVGRTVDTTIRLLFISGTMSGGGSRPVRGRMGRSVAPIEEISADHLTAMAQKLDEKTQQLDNIRRRKRALEETCEKLKKDISQMKSHLERCVTELKVSVD